MTDLAHLLAIGWVVLVWVTFAFAVAHWGPGVARRRVRCPEKNARAKLRVLETEPPDGSGFGAIRASDVLRCSLLGAGPVSCEKRCLAKL
jgi:hypothetical protein